MCSFYRSVHRSMVCNIMFLCQDLGMAQEEKAYSRDKMSDPAYKPPMLSTSVKVAKRGVYMRDTTVRHGATVHFLADANPLFCFDPQTNQPTMK